LRVWHHIFQLALVQFSSMMKATIASLLVVPAVASVNAHGTRNHATTHVKGFLAAGMQPDVVAHTLVQMQDAWKEEAINFVECNASATNSVDQKRCDEGADAFKKSCATVASTVVKASGGDWHIVKEYMDDVCGEKELEGWRRERCQKFAVAVADGMKFDAFGNRENYDGAGVCTGFWSVFTDLERDHVEKARAERKAADETAAVAKAEADKKAAEEAAQAESLRQKEEAEQKAEEAKKASEEAAAELKARQEEAQSKAEESKKKMEEAQKAADDAQHKREIAELHSKKLHTNSSTTNATVVPVNATVEAPVEAPKKNATLMAIRARTHAVTVPF